MLLSRLATAATPPAVEHGAGGGRRSTCLDSHAAGVELVDYKGHEVDLTLRLCCG